jgi:hypothetical protein
MAKIPLLRDLCFPANGFGVATEFAELFVKLHRQPATGDDQAWRDAQQHWEDVVARVLNTDAVTVDAQGHDAMQQAVSAATVLLHRLAHRGRCPVCPTRPPTPRRQHAEQERG